MLSDRIGQIHHQDYLSHSCFFKDRISQLDVHRGEAHREEARQEEVYQVEVHQVEARQAQVHREEAHRVEVSPYRLYSRSHKGIMEATNWWGIRP